MFHQRPHIGQCGHGLTCIENVLKHITQCFTYTKGYTDCQFLHTDKMPGTFKKTLENDAI